MSMLALRRQRSRRQPSQQRSRERVERMLVSAEHLISEGGSDALRMSEVATRANVSIGSLYQFFPDKTALIGALADKAKDDMRSFVIEALEATTDGNTLRIALARMTDIYYELFRQRPVLRDIWTATQVDANLRGRAIEDSRATSTILAEAIMRHAPRLDRHQAASAAFLIMHLGEAAMRLAASLDKREGDAIIASLKQMGDTMIVDLLTQGARAEPAPTAIRAQAMRGSA